VIVVQDLFSVAHIIEEDVLAFVASEGLCLFFGTETR
jgi:hypothetical protein